MAIRKERENLLYCCMKVGWRLFKKIRSYLSYIKFYVNKPSLQEGNNIPNITVSFTTYPAREKMASSGCREFVTSEITTR